MSVIDRVRARLSREPTRYERAWLGSSNAVAFLVVVGVVLDSDLLLGSGQTGIFQRALYPYGPPALTLGVALADGDRRGAVLSAGVLFGYTLLLAAVGTLGAALARAPGYPIAGAVAVAALVGLSALAAR